jgi:GNAT superfamily N-acetyltransferase
LIVDQQIRSRGIGKALLHTAEQWARSHGCNDISVRSNVTRDRAHRFYTRNGYEHTKTQKSFHKRL